jgi:hypothetical protein
MKLKTQSNLPANIDPKLASTLIVGVIVYVLTSLAGLDVSEELRATIATVVGAIVGYLVPPAPAVPK